MIDCTNRARLADFWKGILGGAVDERTCEANWVSLRDVSGFNCLSLQRMPEFKSAKNRLDLEVIDIDSAVQGVLDAERSCWGHVLLRARTFCASWLTLRETNSVSSSEPRTKVDRSTVLNRSERRHAGLERGLYPVQTVKVSPPNRSTVVNSSTEFRLSLVSCLTGRPSGTRAAMAWCSGIPSTSWQACSAEAK